MKTFSNNIFKHKLYYSPLQLNKWNHFEKVPLYSWPPECFDFDLEFSSLKRNSSVSFCPKSPLILWLHCWLKIFCIQNWQGRRYDELSLVDTLAPTHHHPSVVPRPCRIRNLTCSQFPISCWPHQCTALTTKREVIWFWKIQYSQCR